MSSVKDVLDRNLAAVNAHDVDSYVANQHPNVEFVLPGGVTLRGREQVRQYAELQFTAFPDAKLTFGAQVISDDLVATEVTFTGTHTGPLPTPTGVLDATGKTVAMTSMSLLRVLDGLVVFERVFVDQLDMMRQLGAELRLVAQQ
jgi:predicted ester cyclase